eukprot:TRINITY_DN19251_c0_g1_i1.p1 TRINITY_DN19251_c0_g1~~TRINITY_DN19251_c0_g1_i1.p1  ORF type:complete len:604 (-),score=145.54 TRINITY_DN19251_c0_g1_i1:24-1835(-)
MAVVDLSCAGDPQWSAFKLKVALYENILDRNFNRLRERDEEECPLGSLMASLVVAMTQAQAGQADPLTATLQKATRQWTGVLRRAASLEDVLASGWTVGLALSNLQDAFARGAAPQHIDGRDASSFAAGADFAEELRRALDAERRVPASALGALVGTSSSLPAAGLAAALWAQAYNLRIFDAVRAASAAEATALEAEAGTLLRRGFEQLRDGLLLEAEPLASFVGSRFPLLQLLASLQMEAVVKSDVATLMRPSPRWGGVPEKLWPPWFPRELPLRLHVLPNYDSVSNHVRAFRFPYCYETAFLRQVSVMSGLSCSSRPSSSAKGGRSCGSIRLWEVGANLGDCLVWGAAMLAASPNVDQVEAEAFEPMPHAVDAIWRSSQQNFGAGGAHPRARDVELQARRLALGARPGRKSLGFSSGFHAEAQITDEVCTGPSCGNEVVRVETVDRLLAADGYHSQAEARSSSSRVDLLLVHVMGFELEVLRGARRALAAGRVCAVVSQTIHRRLARQEPHIVAARLLEVFPTSLFKLALLTDSGEALPSWMSSSADSAGAASAQLLADELAARRSSSTSSQQMRFAAWTERAGCNESVAVIAARSLWASA